MLPCRRSRSRRSFCSSASSRFRWRLSALVAGSTAASRRASRASVGRRLGRGRLRLIGLDRLVRLGRGGHVDVGVGPLRARLGSGRARTRWGGRARRSGLEAGEEGIDGRLRRRRPPRRRQPGRWRRPRLLDHRVDPLLDRLLDGRLDRLLDHRGDGPRPVPRRLLRSAPRRGLGHSSTDSRSTSSPTPTMRTASSGSGAWSGHQLLCGQAGLGVLRAERTDDPHRRRPAVDGRLATSGFASAAPVSSNAAVSLAGRRRLAASAGSSDPAVSAARGSRRRLCVGTRTSGPPAAARGRPVSGRRSRPRAARWWFRPRRRPGGRRIGRAFTSGSTSRRFVVGVDGAADLGQGHEEALTRGVELLDLGARHLPARRGRRGPGGRPPSPPPTRRAPSRRASSSMRARCCCASAITASARAAPSAKAFSRSPRRPRRSAGPRPGPRGAARGPDLGGRHELGGLGLDGLGRRHPHEEGRWASATVRRKALTSPASKPRSGC